MVRPLTLYPLFLLWQFALSSPVHLPTIQISTSTPSIIPSLRGNNQHPKTTPEELASDPRSTKVTNSHALLPVQGKIIAYNGNETAGVNIYKCYSGRWQDYPSSSQWASFESLWNFNLALMKTGCGTLGVSPENTDEQIQWIRNGIEQVAQSSLVDHRFILVTIMQESIGCVHVPTTNNGHANPGLMQSFQGSSFIGNEASVAEQQASITQMVVDGTQGTQTGYGLAQGINIYGNIYEAARYYNSGSVNEGNLNDPLGATGTYVSDIANRLTGWAGAPRATC